MGAGKVTHAPSERIGAFTLVRSLAWPAMQQGVAYLKEYRSAPRLSCI